MTAILSRPQCVTEIPASTILTTNDMKHFLDKLKLLSVNTLLPNIIIKYQETLNPHSIIM